MDNTPLINNNSKIKEKVNDLLEMNYDVNNLKFNKKFSKKENFLFVFINFIFYLFTLPFFCIGFWVSLVKVDSLEGVVISYFGKIKKVITEPGLHFVPPCLSQRKRINLSLSTMEIKGSHVPDFHGSPLSISAVLTYKVFDPVFALYNVENYNFFIHSQALDVIRKVVSRFPYRSENIEEPSILNESFLIGLCMRELLQKKINVAGIEVIRMELMEFNYSPEIAQSLLQTQQAKAKIEARKYIVDGGVSIVKEALEKLEERGITLNEESKSKIIKDLLVITCSDHGQPVPVLNI